MAKIQTYPTAASPISGSDKMIGTDTANNNATKNFTVTELSSFIKDDGVVLSVNNITPDSSGNVTTNLGMGTVNKLTKVITLDGTDILTVGDSSFSDNGLGVISAGYNSATSSMSFRSGVSNGSSTGYTKASAIGTNAANSSNYVETELISLSLRNAGIYSVDSTNSTLTYVKVGLFDSDNWGSNNAISGIQFNLTDVNITSAGPVNVDATKVEFTANFEASSNSGASGKYLKVTIDGTDYVIALLNP